MALQRAKVISILKCAIAIGEGYSKLGVLSGVPPLCLSDMLLVIEGGWELDVPFMVHLLRVFFCLLGHGSFHFVLCFPFFFFFVLWFIYDLQGFIII